MDARLCKYPPNVVASLVSNYWMNNGHLYYALLKDGHIFVVQGPQCDFTGLDNSDNFPAYTSPERHRRVSNYIDAQLAVIEDLLSTIDYRRSRWAYLVKENTGEHRLMQKPHAMRKITYPTWLPRIRESDLQLIRWGMDDDKALCLWNGRQVEAFMGFEDFSLMKIERMMKGLHALHERKLDFSFEPLAHIVRGDTVIGMVLERVQGRPVEFYDRALVYREFARMHDNHVLWDSDINEFCIFIHNGKMKLATSPQCFLAYDPDKRTEVERKSEAMTWDDLDKMFEQLSTRPNWAHSMEFKYALPPIVNYRPDPSRPLYLPKIYEIYSFPPFRHLETVPRPKKVHKKVTGSHKFASTCTSSKEDDSSLSLVILSKKRTDPPCKDTGPKRKLLLATDVADSEKGGLVLAVSSARKRQTSVSSDESDRTLCGEFDT